MARTGLRLEAPLGGLGLLNLLLGGGGPRRLTGRGRNSDLSLDSGRDKETGRKGFLTSLLGGGTGFFWGALAGSFPGLCGSNPDL